MEPNVNKEPATPVPPGGPLAGGVPRGGPALREPVLSRATIAAILQLAGLTGVMSQANFALLVEVLVAVLPPLITLVGGYLARKKVTPV